MSNLEKLAALQEKRTAIERACKSSGDKKSARERLALLFDEGSFVEINAFVTGDAAAEGVVSGYGTVAERLVYAYAQDYSAIGGALGGANAEKIRTTLEMAGKMGVPVVSIIDSKGARIGEGVDALHAIGQIFAENAALSGVVPQISVVLGTCAGGAVYTPALSDFVVMAEGDASYYMNGPAVVAGATGQAVDAETFGKAEACGRDGSADIVCASEEACFEQVKALLALLPSNNLEGTPLVIPQDDINRVSAVLNSIVPEDGAAIDVMTLIAEIADGGQLFEVGAAYAPGVKTALIRLNGSTVGVVANAEAELTSAAAKKAAKFVRFCDSFNLPLVTLVDAAGFAAEDLHTPDAAAALLYSYANATVPKVTLVVRKAYGSAYLAMCSKTTGADIVLAYPTAEIAIMPAEGAANILYSEEIAAAADPVAARKAKIEEFRDVTAAPYTAAGRGYVDDIIEPDSTRPRIISALEMLATKRVAAIGKKHGNLPL